MAGISEDVENLRVNMDDFMNALDEVHPAYGVSEEELAQVVQNGIIHYDPIVNVGCFVLVEQDNWSLTLFTCIIGTPSQRTALRRAGPDIDAYAARQHPAARASWNRKDSAGRHYRPSFTVPLHQTHHPRQHGWLLGSAEDTVDLESFRG